LLASSLGSWLAPLRVRLPEGRFLICEGGSPRPATPGGPTAWEADAVVCGNRHHPAWICKVPPNVKTTWQVERVAHIIPGMPMPPMPGHAPFLPSTWGRWGLRFGLSAITIRW